jgi:hypothetical protein
MQTQRNSGLNLAFEDSAQGISCQGLLQMRHYRRPAAPNGSGIFRCICWQTATNWETRCSDWLLTEAASFPWLKSRQGLQPTKLSDSASGGENGAKRAILPAPVSRPNRWAWRCRNQNWLQSPVHDLPAWRGLSRLSGGWNIVSQCSNDTETVQNGHLRIQEHQFRLILANQIESVALVKCLKDRFLFLSRDANSRISHGDTNQRFFRSRS